MTWFRVDDHFHSHRKVRALGRQRLAAVGLWLLAGTWSADNGTDGFIPDKLLDSWDAKRRSTGALLAAQLWTVGSQDGESGYQFWQWEQHQPTRAEVLARREKMAKSGRLGGLKSGQSRRSKSEANASGDPSNPDPTRTNRAHTNLSGAAPVGNAPAGAGALDAFALVRSTIGNDITSTTRTALAFEVQRFAAEADEPTLVQALQRWNSRSGVGPKIFGSLIDDIRKEARGARTGPQQTPRENRTDAHFRAEFERLGINLPGPQLKLIEGAQDAV